MATDKNITMKQFNGTDYDTLYPKTKIEQVEGAYTQQQILADSTKGLFGLDATAVPDDAFNVLSRFHKGLGNEYVWEKTKSETVDFVNSKNEFWQNLSIYKDNSGSSPQMRDLAYGKSVKVVNGAAVLDEVFTPTSQPTSDNASYWQSIVPFYFKYNGKVCYADAYVSSNSSSVTVSAYYTAVIQKTVVTSYGYVNSPDPNAYPPAVSDGYTYTALGKLGAIGKPEIGTYVGTGNSACSIVYEKPPKFVAIFSKRTINASDYIPFGFYAPELGSGFITYPQSSQSNYCYLDSCYLRDNAFKTSNNYMDISGRTYQYIFWS